MCEMEFKIAGQLARMKLISDKETLSSALDATSGVHILKAHLQVLNEEWKLFQEVNDYLGSDGVYQVTYQSYQRARTALTALINQVDIPAPTAQQNQSAPSTINLAPLNITVFSGDFIKWPEFRDMFTTHVVNRSMGDVDRLHYLKAYLTGSAAQLVVNLPSSGDQFPIAWEAIRSRYEVPRLLIGAQLEKIIKIQPLTPRSASQLNALINQVHEVVAALKAMKVEFSQGENHFLTYFIISKLDRVTREAWEHSLGSSAEFPTLTQLQHLTLADPEFCTPGPINIIIGADYYGQVITGGLIQLEFPGLIAQHTLFEWIILGPTQHHHHTMIHPGPPIKLENLNLTRTRSQLSVIGIGNAKAGRTKGCVELTLRSQHSSKTLNLHAHVLRGLTIQLPSVSISHNQLTQLQHLTLADPEFCTPGPIKIIIGANYYGQVITGGLIQLEFPGLIAQHTLFEWIILGPTQHHTHQSRRSFQAATIQQDMNLQDILTRFWVQEEIITTHQPQLTPDEEACEAHFARTHSRDSSGRYIVRLPLISPVHKLGDSFKAAYQCLRHLMHRLSKDPQLKQLYMEFMAEYISLNHMEPTTLRSSSVQYFLPHHGVLKQNTNSPKIRVVFNGSKNTSSGLSLNDIMHTGPNLLINIFDILITSRRHRFFFITDVAKMYRQVLVHPDDRHLQQILWFNPDGDITPYMLTTVTYGTRAAPYLAVRALLQLVNDKGHRFPLAVEPLT
ncbi:uncharacterized protein LOC141528398 [Cotesia typhae]|uniref:uncharacterized protein LOC141528398 n=1 Tax=Cotesia typhae TaxID=2053667 RepID=UPI003D692DA6